MPIVPNIIFVILLAIATGYLTFLTTKGGLTDNRFSNFWKKITKRGKLVLYLLLFILLLLIGQEWNSQTDNNRRNLSLEKERNLRDSIIKERVKTGVDSASEKLFNDVVKAFEKQELRLDTVKKTVERIRDSSGKIINVVSEIEHSFKLDINPVTLDSSHGNTRFFKINLRAFKGEIYNINVDIEIIKKSGNEYFLFPKKEIVGIRNDRATEGEIIFVTPRIYASLGTIIYFYVHGSYTNSNKSKKYPIDEICLFDFNEMSSGSPNAQAMYDVRNFLKSRGVISK